MLIKTVEILINLLQNLSKTSLPLLATIGFLVPCSTVAQTQSSFPNPYLQNIELPSTLQNLSIRDIELDSTGSLLFATSHGIYRKRGDKSFIIEATKGMDVTSITLDTDGTIWSAVNIGEIYCSRTDKHWPLMTYIDSINPHRISIYPTSKSNIISLRMNPTSTSQTEVLAYDIQLKKVIAKNKTRVHYNANIIVADDGSIWFPETKINNDTLTLAIYKGGQLMNRLRLSGLRSTFVVSIDLLDSMFYMSGTDVTNINNLYQCDLKESRHLELVSNQAINSYTLAKSKLLYVSDNKIQINNSESFLVAPKSSFRADINKNIWIIDENSSLFLFSDQTAFAFDHALINSHFIINTHNNRKTVVQKKEINKSDSKKLLRSLPAWIEVNNIDFNDAMNDQFVVYQSQLYVLTHANTLNSLFTKTTLKIEKANGQPLKAKILCLTNKDSSTLILGTSAGLYTYDLLSKNLDLIENTQNHYITELAANNHALAYTANDDSLLIHDFHKFVNKKHINGIQSISSTRENIFIFSNNGVYQYNTLGTAAPRLLIDAYSIPFSNCNAYCYATNDTLVFIAGDQQVSMDVQHNSLSNFAIKTESIFINDQPVSKSNNVVFPEINKLTINYSLLADNPIHNFEIELTSPQSKLADIQYYQDEIIAYFYRDHLDRLTLTATFNKSHQQTLDISYPVRLSFWQSNKYLITILSIGGLFTSILIVYQRNKSKQQKSIDRTAGLRLNLLNSRLNPHFVFNAFSLMSNTDDRIDNNALVYNLSNLIRKVFYSSNNKFTTIQEELNLIENLLTVQKIKFPQQFNYHIEIADKINLKTIVIPNMSIFTFVENCVIHAFDREKNDMEILIRISQFDEHIMIEVIDNGVGITNNLNKKSQGFSSGIKSLRERLRLFEELYNLKYNFVLMDDLDEQERTAGTIGIIHFKAQETL